MKKLNTLGLSLALITTIFINVTKFINKAKITHANTPFEIFINNSNLFLSYSICNMIFLN